jgi:hypothetical protein
MPFDLIQVSKRLFKVVDDKGREYSRRGLSKKRAEAQLRALYASYKGEIKGGYKVKIDDKEHDILYGEGFFSDVFDKVKRIAQDKVNEAKALVQQGVQKAQSLIQSNIRQDYPPSVRNTLQIYGDDTIVGLALRRQPIQKAINKALNFITAGKFDKAKQETNYDNLYHLGLVVDVNHENTVKRLLVEKNEVISITTAFTQGDDVEMLIIPIDKSITLNELMNNAKNVMGSDFFTYDAFNNNCQNFIYNILQSNGLLTQNATSFIVQPLDELIKKLPKYTPIVARAITDLAGLANTVIKGRGVFKKYRKGAGKGKPLQTMPKLLLPKKNEEEVPIIDLRPKKIPVVDMRTNKVVKEISQSDLEPKKQEVPIVDMRTGKIVKGGMCCNSCKMANMCGGMRPNDLKQLLKSIMIQYFNDFILTNNRFPRGNEYDDINNLILNDLRNKLLQRNYLPADIASLLRYAIKLMTDQDNTIVTLGIDTENPTIEGGAYKTHREQFLKKHGLADKSYSLKQLSKVSSVPLKILTEVFRRGVGAFKTQGKSVRLKGSFVKNVDAPMSKKLSKEQWGMARVYSFLNGNPSHDNDLRENKKGGAVMIDEAKLAELNKSIPSKEKWEASRKKLKSPPKQTYEEFRKQAEELNKRRAMRDTEQEEASQREFEAIQQRNRQYEEDVKVNPDLEMVSCKYDLQGNPKKTTMTKGECREANSLALQKREKGTSKEFFRKAVGAVADATSLLGQYAPGVPQPLREFSQAVSEYAGEANKPVVQEGSGKKQMTIIEQLKKLKIPKTKYLKAIRNAGRKAGYAEKDIFLADDGKHKIMVKTPTGEVRYAGLAGSSDFHIWNILEEQKRVLEGTADKYRKAYLARATKIKGDWKKDKFSSNSIAINIVWDGIR